METIWLQRSSPDIPWGFRLVGGREFNVPLSVQRVTPGSVAAAGLGPGDLILKVGNVMATNLEHNDAMELVKQAGNILQLTIKKVETSSSPPGPLSPTYGSRVTAQLNDNAGYGSPLKSFGTGIPLNNSNYSPNSNYSSNSTVPGYATTPRNYAPQQLGTRIEIQRVNNPPPPPQPQRSFSHNYEEDGPSFPDYTIPYKQQEPVHDSPGGPVNIRGYVEPAPQNVSYSSKSLPRGGGGYSNNDGGFGGPPAYEPRYNNNQSSFTPINTSTEIKFNTGVSFQPSQPKPVSTVYSGGPSYPYNSQQFSPVEQSYNQEPASYNKPSYSNTAQQFSPNTAPQSYTAPRPFSPPSYPEPVNNTRPQGITTVGFANKPSAYTPETNAYNNGSTPGYGNNYDQSNVHGSGINTYSTLPHTKPSYNTNNNNSYNIYNSAPQPYSAPKPYAPAQASTAKPYQSPMSPVSAYPTNTAPSHPAIRRVSFDQNVQDGGAYSPSTNFSPRPYKSPPPATNYTSYNPPDNYGVSDFGGAPVLQPATYARQDSRSNEGYSATSTYAPPGGPMSPRSESGSYGYPDIRGVSSGLENMGLESPRSYQPQVSSAPPPPPPPPPPSAPPPPPAPPLNDWNPTPYRRQNYQSSQDEPEEQKIPDQLLNTMLQSAKGGGPKPFSYGIDLSELKKKMGPPTAPKPRKGQPNYNSDDGQEVVRPGPPKKPAGQVQSDYFLSRNDDDTPGRVPRKPAGYVQGDYFLNRDEGPRSEVDESSIRVNMGTDPKKQSKSFKVLQWMTETEQDDPEEVVPKTKRPKDPERRHNADDDEMRFTGLHTKADIPSKAFGLLKKISSEDNSPPTQNGKDTLDVAVKLSGPRHDEDEEDGLPESLNTEDMVDKRYKGGNIPSKVFKHLQKTVGDDTPEVPVVSTGAPQNNTAPVSDF